MVNTKPKTLDRSCLERHTIEGDSPVDESVMAGIRKSRASWIGGLNMGGLTPNPK